MVPAILEQWFQAAGDIERQHLLIHAADGMGAMVISPVPRIDDHGSKIRETGSRFKGSTAGEQHESQHPAQEDNRADQGFGCRRNHGETLGHDDQGI